MDFKFKAHQNRKLKKYIKKNTIFLLFHSAKLKSSKWLVTEQDLKKLKLRYYKPLNKIASKTLSESVYRNFSSSVTGFVLFISSNYKTAKLNLPVIVKTLKPSFTLILVKLNDKMYSTTQLKGLPELSYQKSILNLNKVLDTQLKTSYILTNKKKCSK